jgi:hypothetical protein
MTEITIKPEWARAAYFEQAYDISRTSLLRLWRKGTIRGKKMDEARQGGMWYSVADVAKYFEDTTPPTKPKKRNPSPGLIEKLILD